MGIPTRPAPSAMGDAMRHRDVDLSRYFGFTKSRRDARPVRIDGSRGEPVGPARLKNAGHTKGTPRTNLKQRLRKLGISKRKGRWAKK